MYKSKIEVFASDISLNNMNVAWHDLPEQFDDQVDWHIRLSKDVNRTRILLLVLQKNDKKKFSDRFELLAIIPVMFIVVDTVPVTC